MRLRCPVAAGLPPAHHLPAASLQDYLDFIEDVAKKVANVVVLSIPSAHTLAHTGKQVWSS